MPSAKSQTAKKPKFPRTVGQLLGHVNDAESGLVSFIERSKGCGMDNQPKIGSKEALEGHVWTCTRPVYAVVGINETLFNLCKKHFDEFADELRRVPKNELRVHPDLKKTLKNRAASEKAAQKEKGGRK